MHTLFFHLFALVCLRVLVPLLPDDPDRLESYLNKGDMYYHECDNIHALAEYHLAYALAPDSLSTLLRMVRTYNDIGRLKLGIDTSSQRYYQKAVEYAEIMIRLYPMRSESHFWIALSKGSLIPFRGVGDKIRLGKEVQEEARRALELDSTFSHAYVILAIFQREAAKLNWLEKAYVRVVFGQPISGSLEESERLLRLALKFDRRNTYAFYEMYWTYMAMGKTDRAIIALRSLSVVPPTNAREQQQRDKGFEILRTYDSVKHE